MLVMLLVQLHIAECLLLAAEFVYLLRFTLYTLH